jgi:hypothetical protein
VIAILVIPDKFIVHLKRNNSVYLYVLSYSFVGLISAKSAKKK